MNNSEWTQIKTLFEHALTLPAEARANYVANACKGRKSLEKEVQSLLMFADDSPYFLDEPIHVPVKLLLTEEKSPPVLGQRLGPYVLIDKLGRGGMGNVFLAHRIEGQFLQQVAIKLIRTDRLRPETRIRFDRERQILANLNHPGIAKLLDGGITDEDVPYLVMEYVEGRPLLEYRKHTQISPHDLHELLKLFQQICNAVHAAHQSLVIHRDLKPSNILVSQNPTAGPLAKLLDFGIAKLINTDEDHDLTLTGARAMTPEYASPEQIRGDVITTASDIYALGIILYELLTGSRPYDLRGKSPGEIEHIVCEKMPTKPSTIAAGLDENTVNTQSLPAKSFPAKSFPAKTIKGDLDNIILKALNKDPGRRYESAAQFSADIGAYLQTRPVLARPDTLSYRITKYISRNRAGVAMGCLVLLLIAGGFWSTRRQARIANQRFEQVRSLANSLLSDLHNAIRDLPGATHAREMLVTRALTYLDELSQDQNSDPSLLFELASAYEKVGRIQGDPHYTNLGDLKGAYESYEKAYELRLQLWEEHPSNARFQHAFAVSLGRLAVVKSWSKEQNSAVEYSMRALDLMESLLSAYPNDSLLHDKGRIQSELGWYKIWSGEIDDGLEILSHATQTLETIPAGVPHTLDVKLDLWRAYYYTIDGLRFSKRNAEALQILQERAVGMLEQLVKTYPTNSRVQYSYHTCLWFMGAQYEALGNIDASLSAYTASLEAAEAMVTADTANQKGHEAEAFAYSALARIYNSRGQSDKAVLFFDKAIEIRTRLVAANPENASLGRALAGVYRRKCQFLLAAKFLDQALENCNQAVTLDAKIYTEQKSSVISRGITAYTYAHLARVHRNLGLQASIFEQQTSQYKDALYWYNKSYSILNEIRAIEPDLAWEVHPDSVRAEIEEMEQFLQY